MQALFKSWWKVVVTGFLVALTAAMVSTPIAVYLYGGITASGSSFITAYLLQTGQGVLQAVFSTNFLVEPVDKITTCMLAFAIVQGLSKRLIARFPRPENVETEGGTSQYSAVHRRRRCCVTARLFARSCFAISSAANFMIWKKRPDFSKPGLFFYPTAQ